jgi:shikimate dehydrogenase
MTIEGTTRLVGLIGDPVTGSLSPRMQNAAFSACGLDWAYVPLPVRADAVAEAIRGLVALGFAGANVTVPHKRSAAAACDESEGGSVNTLVVEDGRVLGFNTDQEIVRGLDAARVCLIGAGGAAEAVLPGLAGAEVRTFARREEWPPDASGCDLVVNATPVKDEVLVELRPEQAVVDLAYRPDGRETALVAEARRVGCRAVIDGLEALVRQGSRSFERWTGVPAPVDVMRAAVQP